MKLVWGTPAVPGGRWRGGLLNLRSIRRLAGDADARARTLEAYKRHRIHVSLRGLGVWMLSLAIGGHLVGAGVIAWRLHTTTAHNQIGYADLVLPWRWSGLDEKRGAALIAQARDRLAAGDLSTGFQLLRAGLGRQPGDLAARLDLARLHATLRLNGKAARLLEDGLALGQPDRRYLETLLALLADTGQPPRRAAVAARALADRGPTDPLRPWLVTENLHALRAVGQPEAALALAARELPPDEPTRRELEILSKLENGHGAEAAAMAERWIKDAPDRPEPLRLRATIARQAGDLPTLRANLDALRRLAPEPPDTYLFAYVQSRRAGDEAGARDAWDRLMLRHGADPELHLALALVLTDLQDRAGLDQLAATCRELGASTDPVWWARLQLARLDRDWPGVRAAAQELRRSGTRTHTTDVEIADALARSKLEGGTGPRSDLIETVARLALPLPTSLATLDFLISEGDGPTAREILNLIEGPYADAEGLTRRRDAIAALPTPPEPAPAPERPATPEFSGYEAFAEIFRTGLAAGREAEMRALLTEVRRSGADWAAVATARLDALELPLAARDPDPSRARLLARSLLARGEAFASDVLSVARACQAAGDTDRARLLVRELLRAHPDDPEALASLQAWTPTEAEPGRRE